MEQYRENVYSQGGEDGVISEILRRLGIERGFSCEFGARDGKSLSNTWRLIESGWGGAFLECSQKWFQELCKNCRGRPNVYAIKAKVTAGPGGRVDDHLRKFGIKNVDLLSIDVDGIDYWLWQATSFTPAVVVIEYNSNFGPDEAKTIRYDPNFTYKDGPNGKYYGASAAALYKLGQAKGYRMVAFTPRLNLFFVRKDLPWDGPELTPADIPRATAHKGSGTEKMVDV